MKNYNHDFITAKNFNIELITTQCFENSEYQPTVCIEKQKDFQYKFQGQTVAVIQHMKILKFQHVQEDTRRPLLYMCWPVKNSVYSALWDSVQLRVNSILFLAWTFSISHFLKMPLYSIIYG